MVTLVVHILPYILAAIVPHTALYIFNELSTCYLLGGNDHGSIIYTPWGPAMGV
jgi:hypothetical protein